MIWDTLLDIILPLRCVGCGVETGKERVVCDKCFSEIETFKTAFCGQCVARLPEAKKICHPSFPYILGAATDYHQEIPKKLIQNLKFKFAKKNAKHLAELLGVYFRKLPIQASDYLVLPIPLSKQRRRERGFNQTELIAEIFARDFALDFDSKNLIRYANPFPQSELKDFQQRWDNVKNCFSLLNPTGVERRNIILIDDVVTSGATFFEASKALREAGARKILALAAAKARG